MKTIPRILALVALLAVIGLVLLKAQIGPPPAPSLIEKAGLKPLEGRPLVDAETQQLNSLLTTAATAANSIVPNPDAGAQRRLVDLELCAEMEGFATNYPSSAWTPGVHVWLARRALLRCGYSLAMDHFQQAFAAVESGISGPVGESIALESSGGLAKLLALTGQLTIYDALEGAATQLLQRRPAGYDWAWAHDMRALPPTGYHNSRWAGSRQVSAARPPRQAVAVL